MQLYPLKFKPVYRDYLWGGKRIADHFGRDLPSKGICAESWEISAHSDGMSLVENGPLKGKTLKDLISKYGTDLVGESWGGKDFPLLIKLLDAERNLSVQVHPHDDNAYLTGGDPKTELQYILDAKPDTEMIAGLEEGVDIEILRKALSSGRMEDIFHRVPIKPGDAVFMPGGRVHAICTGALILEVQQSSNTTYRLYDWDRVDSDGRPRELHIEQALKVVRFEDNDVTKPEPVLLNDGQNRIWSILSSPYFEIERIELETEHNSLGDSQRFTVLFCQKGAAQIEWEQGDLSIELGRSVLIPAAINGYKLTPTDSDCQIIKISPGIN